MDIRTLKVDADAFIQPLVDAGYTVFHTSAKEDAQEAVKEALGDLFDFWAIDAEMAADGLKEEGWIVHQSIEEAAEAVGEDERWMVVDASANPGAVELLSITERPLDQAGVMNLGKLLGERLDEAQRAMLIGLLIQAGK